MSTETMGTEAVGEDILQVSMKDMIQEDACLHKLEGIEEPNQGPGFAKSIKFMDEPITGGMNPATDVNTFPNDAIDECPLPKRIRSFYFVKLRPDRKLKTIIDQAEEDLKETIKVRFEISEAIKKYKIDRAKVTSKLKSLNIECKIYKPICEKEEMVMRKLRSVRNVNHERDGDLCSSVEELNYTISSLRYRLQHKNNNLVDGKRLLREIKQLEGTREKVISNDAITLEIYDPLSHQRKLIDVEWAIRYVENTLQAIDNVINTLQEKLTPAKKRIAEYERSLNKLKKQHDKRSALCYRNSLLLNNARELAAKKDVATLEELSHIEVEKFMSLWSSNKSFRDDYVYRTFASLENRQLSRDGRTRNPDKNPLVSTTESDSLMPLISRIRNMKKMEREIGRWYYCDFYCQVEIFMCLWRSNKSFMDYFVGRSWPSIDNWKLSRDGRMKNPDDKPLVSEATTTTELESVIKENIKKSMKDSNTT